MANTNKFEVLPMGLCRICSENFKKLPEIRKIYNKRL